MGRRSACVPRAPSPVTAPSAGRAAVEEPRDVSVCSAAMLGSGARRGAARMGVGAQHWPDHLHPRLERGRLVRSRDITGGHGRLGRFSENQTVRGPEACDPPHRWRQQTAAASSSSSGAGCRRERVLSRWSHASTSRPSRRRPASPRQWYSRNGARSWGLLSEARLTSLRHGPAIGSQRRVPHPVSTFSSLAAPLLEPHVAIGKGSPPKIPSAAACFVIAHAA